MNPRLLRPGGHGRQPGPPGGLFVSSRPDTLKGFGRTEAPPIEANHGEADVHRQSIRPAPEKQAVSRAENGERKRRERVNRDKRMKEVILNGSWPFTPAIMSWVSVQLDKPTRQITETEVWRLVGKE